MALQPNQLDDFVKNTLPFFHKNRWKDISLDLQDYIFASKAARSLFAVVNTSKNRFRCATQARLNTRACMV